MPKAKQLNVFCENRPGGLAQIAKVLSDAKVNILAFLTATSGIEEGSAQVVVDNVNRAKRFWSGEALSSEADMLHAELPNVPGALAGFAAKLALKEINITSGYATTVKGSRKASVLLAVSDLDKAARVR
jgi:hypothetical protein